MNIHKVLALFEQHQNTAQILSRFKSKTEKTQLKGLCGAANAFATAAVIKQTKHPHLIILSDKEEAAYFYNDLQNVLGKERTLFFPASYTHPYQDEKTDNANVLQRAEVLNKISKDSSPVIVSYPRAIAEKVVTKKHLKQNTLAIKNGDSLSIDFINEVLFEYEFERVDFVYEPGQFSIRGGIVDVFSFSNDFPYRIEFFGDDIESIRSFDPANQLSIKNYHSISIIPNIQNKLLKESRETFMEFIPPRTKLWIKNIQLTIDRLNKELEKATAAYERLTSDIKYLAPGELYFTSTAFLNQLDTFSLVEFGTQFYFKNSDSIVYHQKLQPTFNKNFDLLKIDLDKNEKQGIKNIIFAENTKQIERLNAIFEDSERTINFSTIPLAIHQGFIDSDVNIACYTDHQIFERYHRFRLKEGFTKNKQALTIKELTQLQPGDYVTHVDYGVGKFAGLEKIDVNGKPQEALRLVYKDGDILYVSIHSLHRISKFSGKEGIEPAINKIGSKAWKTLKQKTKKRIKEIAYDLIKLYAKRKATKGFQYAPDSYLQNELEASFLYEETPDQLTTIEAIKKDMESESPMDRLVCGDVGFGKTEMAIRATFKAVADSKQVAILVPTTILALQHYNTFKERLKDFPCTIDYLNRFKSAKQQTETVKKVAEGKVDILIGTHRIAGKDIKFKDLGLLIIDEEQKFGVSVKDKLKTMRENVDTLTLTATPIPRTLQFSLMGARDLSLMNTPPANRQPIQTELHPFNEKVIRDAIHYEVSRGGQVFFINNRIENIQEMAGMIQRLLPDINIGIAHGQMEGKKLEEIMIAFIDGAYDLLISTTIIESGLDIPNANTILINKAHMFGLSDLHQMRGRVGRSNKKAFCYLLSPPLSTLTSEARKRLQAIEQFSDLGSGINIAMRDLDIRGAGNLLGADQSGFINDIGIETFQKILNEALDELKQDEFKELFEEEKNKVFVKDCIIETDMEILIPDDYVNNLTERLALYKELDSIENEEKLLIFEKNSIDRFGEIPPSTVELFNTIRLRWQAKILGFEKIILKNKKMVCYFLSNAESSFFESNIFGNILDYIQKNPKICNMKQNGNKLSLSFVEIKKIEDAIKLLSLFTVK